jgi:hypothetical protein
MSFDQREDAYAVKMQAEARRPMQDVWQSAKIADQPPGYYGPPGAIGNQASLSTPTLSMLVQSYAQLLGMSEDILKRARATNARLHSNHGPGTLDGPDTAPASESPLHQLYAIHCALDRNLSKISAEVSRMNEIL